MTQQTVSLSTEITSDPLDEYIKENYEENYDLDYSDNFNDNFIEEYWDRVSLVQVLPLIYASHGPNPHIVDLNDSVGFSDSVDTTASFSIILSDTLDFTDSIINDLIEFIEPVIEPTITPAPTSSKSSSGGGNRINLSTEQMSKKSGTSFSRVADWVSSEDYFRIGMRDIITKGYVDHTGQIPSSAPDWFYSTGKAWKDGHVSNKEYFDAVNYLINKKILR